ncbi:MAG: 50S ribosomal protein L6 [Candidatus Altiarchaeota archaeon]|nr:50S ribosomal protein L6 [Candidatus Altiarchaeota archaeon]
MEDKKHSSEIEVDLIEGAEVEVKGRTIDVKGPKGGLSWKFKEDFIQLEKKDGKVMISARSKRYPLRKQMAIMGAIAGHIKNMMAGVTEGFTYKLRIVYSHFPMKVQVKGTDVTIDNFLGEKYPRKAKIFEGVKVDVKGSDVTVSGIDKEKVGQTAANIEQDAIVRKLDKRVFQDGIYIIEKHGKLII